MLQNDTITGTGLNNEKLSYFVTIQSINTQNQKKQKQPIKEFEYLTHQYFYIIILLFLLIKQQQTQMKNQILQTFNLILTEPILNHVARTDQEKLSNLTKKSKERNFLLKIIQQSLKHSEVIIRLKVLCMLQNLMSSQLQQENIRLINSTITTHEKRVLKNIQKCLDTSEMNNYLQINVQLPYTVFLRKIIYWQNHEDGQALDTSLGFSFINKLKEIIQLKKMFHNYGCYYPNHRYAINMFRQTLFFVKKFWYDICFMIKHITLQAIHTNSILQEEFLFIYAAEEMQQALIQFLYGGYFSKTIGKDKKIKFDQLLKPEILRLQSQRKKKVEEKNMIECLQQKRQGFKLGQKNHLKKTGDSQSVDEKLTTQMEVEILNSILRLQSLLSE